MSRRGFTLIELLVVIAMILVLTGAFTTSVQKARERARIARATQEVREMTNAILAFENYARNHELKANGGWTDCSESSMAMILGRETGGNGERVPVLYNGHVERGQLRDPWGRPYQYMIRLASEMSSTDDDETSSGLKNLKMAAALPNANRLTDAERNR